MKLSKSKLLATCLMLFIIIISPFLVGCKDNKIYATSVTYMSYNSKVSKSSISIYKITGVYIYDASNNKQLKNITKLFNESKSKKEYFIASTSITKDDWCLCPFQYSDLKLKYQESGYYYYYSTQFSRNVYIEIYLNIEKTIKISIQNKDNLSTITYPVARNKYYEPIDTPDCYTLSVTISTENIIEIKY